LERWDEKSCFDKKEYKMGAKGEGRR